MKCNFYSDRQYNVSVLESTWARMSYIFLNREHVLLFGLPLCDEKNESLRN
jgi:hypothetical protein